MLVWDCMYCMPGKICKLEHEEVCGVVAILNRVGRVSDKGVYLQAMRVVLLRSHSKTTVTYGRVSGVVSSWLSH